jgi:hypothetical protein
MARCLNRNDLYENHESKSLGYLEDADCTLKSCFLCWEKIGNPETEPAVFWSGCIGAIYFHAHCAESFGAHIIKDGMTARHDYERAVFERVRENDS